MSVMFVVAKTADVVPGRGLVAAITLGYLSWPAASGYLRIFLSGNLLRNHVEVHHIVARRSLVALSAVERAWRRMLEFSNSPTGCCVALCAFYAEQSQVPVFSGVASSAVESLAGGTLVELTRNSNAQPRLKRLERSGAASVCSRRARKCSCADLGELHVVHRDRADVRTLMLDVTCSTFPDAGVECGGLTAEQPFGVRMAGRALRGRYSDGRLVARFASIGEVSVFRR